MISCLALLVIVVVLLVTAKRHQPVAMMLIIFIVIIGLYFAMLLLIIRLNCLKSLCEIVCLFKKVIVPRVQATVVILLIIR